MMTTHPKFIVCKLTIEAVKLTLGFVVLLVLVGATPSISAQSLDGKFDVGGRHIRLAAKGADILRSLSMPDWGPLQWRTLLGSKLHRRLPL